MAAEVKYPIGDQSFGEIIRNGCVYVDKTAYIHKMVTEGKYYFLSRPRRFGKSLLVSTLEEYFRGNRELFSRLAIDRLEPEEWNSHPVLHLDLNGKDYTNPSALYEQLEMHLDNWEATYGRNGNVPSVDNRFREVIKSAYVKTGSRVAVLIDEYDKPIVDAQDNEQLVEKYRNILRGFYGVMKSCSDYLKFVFLTGVGKLGQVNIFSGLNNLRDLSMNPEYSAICGITTDELVDNLQQGIRELGRSKGWSAEQTLQALKHNYDGYHFAEDMTDVYNPFSLLNALADKKLSNYWYQSGASKRLYDRLKDWDSPLRDLEGTLVSPRVLETGDVLGNDLEVLFYYTGYLTIKQVMDSFDGELLVLGYPNQEVRDSFFEGLAREWTRMSENKRHIWVNGLRRSIHEGDIDRFLTMIQEFMAGNSYRTNPDTEIHYQDLIYIISRLVGLNVDVERATSDGRIDMMLDGPKAIYIIEFKLDKSPEEALRQIDEKHYDRLYLSLGKPIVKVGVNISTATRTLDSWLIKDDA